jgi:flagellar basal-body rod modification protein FlgD
MDMPIQSQFRTMGVTPPNTDSKGHATTNVVDLDPTAIVEQFAKMLVSQISNQDPDNAMDPTQIVTQYSQMTASLAMAKLTNQTGFYEHIRLAASCVGKTISYFDPTDDSNSILLTGTVTEADFTGQNPKVIVNGTDAVPVPKIATIYM